MSIGALAALWAATGGTVALVKAMNRAYGIEDDRGIFHRYALAAGLTILGGMIILGSFVTVVGGAIVTEQLTARLGLPDGQAAVVSALRWPVVFALLVLATAILFRYAPNVRIAWRWTLAGGITFALGWLIATYALAWYVGNFGAYGTTYGSLGGVIVLMLWFYVTGLLLVGSAEIIASFATVVEPEALQRRRDELEQARRSTLVDKAKAEVNAAVDGVREALPDDGSPEEDRRTGPPDRRRPLETPPAGADA
jgi:membrane protein